MKNAKFSQAINTFYLGTKVISNLLLLIFFSEKKLCVSFYICAYVSVSYRIVGLGSLGSYCQILFHLSCVILQNAESDYFPAALSLECICKFLYFASFLSEKWYTNVVLIAFLMYFKQGLLNFIFFLLCC